MMFERRAIELARRREQLIARAAIQRERLADHVRQWERPIAAVDKVIAGVNYLRAHPVVLAVGIAVLTVVQRRSLWGLVRRGFLLWRIARTWRRFSSKFLA